MSILKSFRLQKGSSKDDAKAPNLNKYPHSIHMNPFSGSSGNKHYSFAKLNKIVIIALKDLTELSEDMRGNVIPRQEMLFTLNRVIETLSSTVDLNGPDEYDSDSKNEEDDDAQVPKEVQSWLQRTFMNRNESESKVSLNKEILASPAAYFKKLIGGNRTRRSSKYQTIINVEEINPEVKGLLENDKLWQFDIFEVSKLCGDQSLKVILNYFFQKYNMFNIFMIERKPFNALMNHIAFGYERYNNPYHNTLHGADVLQTLHTLLILNNFLYYLSPLELFTSFFAAAIHDYDHQGVTNNFIIDNKYELALTYNDFAVQENHHVSSVFKLMRKPFLNITSNMKHEQFNEFRSLCIKMVLATDMSQHFIQVKKFNTSIQTNEIIKMHDYLAVLLHTADLSNPAKEWSTHVRWVVYIFNEFFSQGDRERALGMPISPLCDRNSTLIFQSQIGFLDFIIQPTFDLFSNISEGILAQHQRDKSNDHSVTRIKPRKGMSNLVIQFKYCNNRPWDVCIMQNRSNWRRKGDKDYYEQKLIIEQGLDDKKNIIYKKTLSIL